MKTIYLILIALLGFQTSCTKSETIDENQDRLIGKWQLVEIFGSDGGEGNWSIVENGYFYQFKENGVLESNRFNCNGNYTLEENLEFNLLISFNCDENQFQDYHKFEFEEENLIIWDEGCIEGCAGKFKRFQDQ